MKTWEPGKPDPLCALCRATPGLVVVRAEAQVRGGCRVVVAVRLVPTTIEVTIDRSSEARAGDRMVPCPSCSTIEVAAARELEGKVIAVTMDAEVTIQEKGGRVVGPVRVHGSGGAITVAPADRARLEKALERATDGLSLVGFYEPRPGHVRGYAWLGARKGPKGDGYGPDVEIDLRGAKLLEWR